MKKLMSKKLIVTLTGIITMFLSVFFMEDPQPMINGIATILVPYLGAQAAIDFKKAASESQMIVQAIEDIILEDAEIEVANINY